jgi:hypothetical protein
MTPAAPYTACANGCGIKAMWKVTRGGRTKNLCNACVTRSHDRSKVKHDTRTNIENRRKAEVLSRLGYDR